MQSVGMILYMLLFGGIAGGIWTRFNRNNVEDHIIHYGIKSSLFFFAGFYFTVSIIKFYLDEAESTLPESFWDVEGRTYLHYGIIFAIITIIAPLLMKQFLSFKGYSLVHIFDSVYIVVILTGLSLFGRIDNRIYCILYGFCMLIGFGITYTKKCSGWDTYLHNIEYKSSFLQALPFVSAWVVMTGIYFPNELYINNSQDFVGNYVVFFLIMLVGSIAEILFLLFVFLLFFPKKLFRIVYLLFAGISCAGYLQTILFNGTLNAMNGEQQVWSGQKIFVNIGIWFVILSAAVIGGFCKTTVRKICRVLCIYISLVQFATLGWLVITSDINNQNENEAITRKGALELAQNNNVVVFVLDNFDSGWFEEICLEDDSILEPLTDFTYYRNGTSQFAYTNLGIPYMLTGVEWNSDKENYFDYAYKNSNFLEKMAENKIDVRVFTDLSLIYDQLYPILDNYSNQVVRKYNIIRTFGTMKKTAIYKTAPFLLKPVYKYYSSDINEMSYNNEIWSIDNDLLFYQNIIEDGLQISVDEKNAFRFYHMMGPHTPFYLTEDLKYDPTGKATSANLQGKGSLKIVYEYMEQMKALEKYDNATIIITADHGNKSLSDSPQSDRKPDRTSRPLFLVKKSGEHHENMEISEAPVSQAELIPTILNAFGIDYTSYGRTFDEIRVDERRIRKYVYIYSDTVEYVIDGHAADPGSWSIENAIYNN